MLRMQHSTAGGSRATPPALATVHGGKGLDGHIHKRGAGFAANGRRQRDQRAGPLLRVGEVSRDWQDLGQPRAWAELRREQRDQLGAVAIVVRPGGIGL